MTSRLQGSLSSHSTTESLLGWGGNTRGRHDENPRGDRTFRIPLGHSSHLVKEKRQNSTVLHRPLSFQRGHQETQLSSSQYAGLSGKPRRSQVHFFHGFELSLLASQFDKGQDLILQCWRRSMAIHSDALWLVQCPSYFWEADGTRPWTVIVSLLLGPYPHFQSSSEQTSGACSMYRAKLANSLAGRGLS